MANTPNLDLVKPAGTDQALISVINSNSDKIDTGFGSLSDQIGTLNSKITNGTLLKTVTADGTKTYAQLISELFSGVSFGKNTIIVTQDRYVFYLNDISNKEFSYKGSSNTSYATLVIREIVGVGNYYLEGVGTMSLTNYSSNKPSSGFTIKLITFN